jgi:hypothetical protein
MHRHPSGASTRDMQGLDLPLNWNLVFIRWMASAFGSLKLSVRGGGGSSLNAGDRLDFGDISSASYV